MEREIEDVGILNDDVKTLSNCALKSFMIALAHGKCHLETYDDIFQEAYDRNLYNKAVIFNLHQWTDYMHNKTDYHPKSLACINCIDKSVYFIKAGLCRSK